MVGTWMLCGNGYGLAGRYHGWDMDALQERMGSGWMLDMDALRERIGSGGTLSWLRHGCSARTDGVWVDVVMVETCDMDALRKRMRSGWTLSWLGHGFCAGFFGITAGSKDFAG